MDRFPRVSGCVPIVDVSRAARAGDALDLSVCWTEPRATNSGSGPAHDTAEAPDVASNQPINGTATAERVDPTLAKLKKT